MHRFRPRRYKMDARYLAMRAGGGDQRSDGNADRRPAVLCIRVAATSHVLIFAAKLIE